MRPISFTREGEVIKFHYDQKAYDEWYLLGTTEGTVGALLVAREGIIDEFLCFGTLENPMTSPATMHIMHNEPFDGLMKSPEEICRVPTQEEIDAANPFTNYRMVFLDCTDASEVIRIVPTNPNTDDTEGNNH